MSILFGHPSGAPFAHNAALAHYEAGRLEAFCVPWMPSQSALRMLRAISPIRPMAERLARRRFEPLVHAPRVQGRAQEFIRLAARAMGASSERIAYQANDWLMRTMRRNARRASVTAVHSYEDCSLWQFQEARKLG